MPIIPVLQPEGDVSVPTAAVPDINSLSYAYASKAAAGVSDLGDVVVKLANERAHVSARLDAIKAATSIKAELDQAKLEVMQGPQQVRPGSVNVGQEDPASGEGNQAPAVGPSSLIPKSESMVHEYEQRAQAIRQKYEKNLSGLAWQYGQSAIERAIGTGQKAMQEQQQHTWTQEQMVAVGQGAAVIHRQTAALPADQPVGQADGSIVYTPENNAGFMNQQKAINQYFDDVRAKTGLHPDVVEKLRTAELKSLYKNFAEKTMYADPASFALSAADGKNGWLRTGYLDDIASDRLQDKANAAVTRKNSNEERQLKLARERADSDLSVFEAAGNIPMDEIVTRAPNLGREGVKYWKERRAELLNGHWDDKPEVVRPLTVLALEFNPAPGIEQRLTDAYVDHNMSDATYKSLQAAVRTSRERQLNRSTDLGVRQASREHSALSAMLQPPPQMKDEKGILQANYADALTEWTKRITEEGEANAPKITAETIKKYRPRMVDYIDNHQTELNTFGIKLDKATGLADPASVSEARRRLGEKYGVTPENAAAMRRAGKIPKEFEDGLDQINDVVELGKLKNAAIQRGPS